MESPEIGRREFLMAFGLVGATSWVEYVSSREAPSLTPHKGRYEVELHGHEGDCNLQLNHTESNYTRDIEPDEDSLVLPVEGVYRLETEDGDWHQEFEVNGDVTAVFVENPWICES